jgi:HEAT repeat protein
MAYLPGKSMDSNWIQHFTSRILIRVWLLLACLGCAITVTAQDTTETPPAPDGRILSMFYNGYGISILLIGVLIILIVARKIRATRGRWEAVEDESKQPDPQRKSEPIAQPKHQMVRPHSETKIAVRPSEQHWESPNQTGPDAAFGAYRVDQEVWKLVLGKTHRMDVMASRVPDDRRAIEASLVKVLSAPETDDDGRRRARQALEEYGFLARQSALLLLGRDAWERSSAARMLGQIGSQSSLPYLIEALHDSDVVVRNQAVASLGSLRLPAAIGALLDIARRHPDIPAALLSEALSSCSVETSGFLDISLDEPGLISAGSVDEEPVEAEPFASFKDLPEGSDDAGLADALAKSGSEDDEVRTLAAQLLALYPVQQSVLALTSLATADIDAGVRATAVASLGSIDHESVFAPVLIALADESREVQAAAARTLTSLRFDRGDGYVRAMETADAQTLRQVARACIKIGIVSQALDRLASEDRRQAYEAFSLFSLLVKANETGPIIEAIEKHRDENVRLSAVRVLSVSAQPGLAPKLRELVASENISESLRTSILEVLYKLDQFLPANVPALSDNVTSDVA